MKRQRSSLRIALVVWAATLTLGATNALAAGPQDAWTTTKVKLALLRADDVDALAIDVDTLDGYVTLHGLADSVAERESAGEAALRVDGAEEVRNLLAVVPEADREQVEAADATTKAQVDQLLERDWALAGSDIRVKSVHQGIVVLAGTADSWGAHRLAVDQARGVEGVRLVASEIRSPDADRDRMLWREADARGSGFTDALDAWITSRAEARLATDLGLSPAEVSIDTQEGVVTLFGSVPSSEGKSLAGRRVEEIAGVRELRNELQVVSDLALKRESTRDERVADAVRERLDHEEIEVEVSDGVVRLSGEVDTFAEKLEAIETAESAAGVVRIVDSLQVRRPRKG